MDNEMIERCARAILKDAGLLENKDTLGTASRYTMTIIKSMREPTDKIIEAAFGKSDLSPHPFRTAWYNMIDAITND